jgi:hypothetical protein
MIRPGWLAAVSGASLPGLSFFGFLLAFDMISDNVNGFLHQCQQMAQFLWHMGKYHFRQTRRLLQN